jgi:hypothetical protein
VTGVTEWEGLQGVFQPVRREKRETEEGGDQSLEEGPRGVGEIEGTTLSEVGKNGF